VAKNFQVEVLVEISNNMKKSVKDQKSSIFVNIAPNNLNSIILKFDMKRDVGIDLVK
jgi:hypothetical protein